MHRKPIILLLLICGLLFANSLRNGFVGDDNFLVLQNDFYTSWANVKDLFTDKYLTDSTQAISPADNARYFSGSVAYRPVLSLTYFLDHAVWKQQPFGYHFTSLLWHMANVCLVYVLIFLLGRNVTSAVLTSLIFAVHPFKSEAVCAISYRADLVVSLFVLLAMTGHILYRQRKDVRWSIAAHGALFLAIFAKEAAIVFPALVFLYDRMFPDTRAKNGVWRQYLAPYVGYAAICAFYLYVYLFVFPNEQATSVGLLGGALGQHVLTSLQIVAGYITGFFFPLFVTVLPPVFSPTMPEPSGPMALVMVLIVILSIWVSLWFARRGPSQAVLIGWFWITLIPVSNIIPLVNPMAHRFMYLPSVGMAFLLAQLIFQVGSWLNAQYHSGNFVYILAAAYLVSCGVPTFNINAAWQHDFLMAYRLYQKHPRDPVSHLFMGLTYVRIGEPAKAERVILKGIQLGLDDPRVYYILALSRKDDLDTAIAYLNKGVEVYPDYAMLHLGLGRSYLLKGDLLRARQALRQSLELQPSYRAYNYLFQVLLMEDDEQAIAAVQREISAVLHDPKYDAFLDHTLEIKDTLTLPEDSGF